MKKSTYKFSVGDRVAERPRAQLNFSNKGKALKVHQRFGTVTALTQKKDRRGRARKFIQVVWDGTQSPSEHEQMRLCSESEFQAEFEATLLVIGE